MAEHKCARCGVADENVKTFRDYGRFVTEHLYPQLCANALKRDNAALREKMGRVAGLLAECVFQMKPWPDMLDDDGEGDAANAMRELLHRAAAYLESEDYKKEMGDEQSR